MMSAPRSTSFTPAILTTLVATAIAAYAVHSAAWVLHELNQDEAWPRWLELTYLVSLFIWVPAFLVALVGKARLQKTTPRVVLDDERSGALFIQAHQVALVVVLVLQVPFFFVSVPSNVLAQITVTTCVVALFAAYAWFDR